MPAPKLTPLPNSEQTLRSQLKEENFFRGQKTGTGYRRCTGVEARIGISREADREVLLSGGGQGPQPPSAAEGLGSVGLGFR